MKHETKKKEKNEIHSFGMHHIVYNINRNNHFVFVEKKKKNGECKQK